MNDDERLDGAGNWRLVAVVVSGRVPEACGCDYGCHVELGHEVCNVVIVIITIVVIIRDVGSVMLKPRLLI